MVGDGGGCALRTCSDTEADTDYYDQVGRVAGWPGICDSVPLCPLYPALRSSSRILYLLSAYTSSASPIFCCSQLGVATNASQQEIRRAYFQRSRPLCCRAICRSVTQNSRRTWRCFNKFQQCNSAGSVTRTRLRRRMPRHEVKQTPPPPHFPLSCALPLGLSSLSDFLSFCFC